MKKKVLTIIVTIVFLAVLSVAFFFIYTNKAALGDETNEIWDGTTIATGFNGGNGTEDNPYLISNGNELAYLQKVMAGTEATSYSTLYYSITNDINLGSNELAPIGTETAFSGHIEGNGNTIKNAVVTGESLEEETNYYGLFGLLDNATINNLNIDGINITITGDGNVNIGALAGSLTNDTQNTNTISNISIRNIDIDVSEMELTGTSNVAGFIGIIGENYNITNISIYGSIDVITVANASMITRSTESPLTNIVYSIESDNTLQKINEENGQTLTNIYEYTDSKYYLNGVEVTEQTVLDAFNLNQTDYEWESDNNQLVLAVAEEEEEVDEPEQATGPTMPGGSTPIAIHATGKDSSTGTVYINDLQSDWDYYEGQNYVDFKSENTVPNFTNKNLYSSSNLAKIYIKYSGASIDHTSRIGYVSNTDNYKDFVYYKYYPIENGYVKIPLIDNPYAKRPMENGSELMFNGWITDYTGAEVSIDMDTYDRYVTIPAPSNPSVATSITMYASWTKGKIYQMTSSQTLTTAESSFTTNMVQTTYTYNDYGTNDFSIFYLRRTTRNNYPSGAVNQYGQTLTGRCQSNFTACTYYIQAGTDYDETETYYVLNSQSGASTATYTTVTANSLETGDILAGFFRAVTVNGSKVGYYDNTGTLQTSGTASNQTYYELIPYSTNGTVNTLSSGDTNTYYLSTRDTNIVILRASLSRSNNNRYNNTKPMTITSLYGGSDYRSSGSINLYNGYIYPSADLRIEYITTAGNISADASTNAKPASSLTYENMYGNYQNFKVGRGIEFPTTTTRVNASSVVAGNLSTTGSSSSLTKYKMIVESGKYNNISVTGGAATTSVNQYVDAVAVLGCDFDRVDADNDFLHIYHSTAGGWGGNLRSNANNKVAVTQIIKSGSYGTSKNNYSCGIYAGGRGSTGNIHYAARQVTVEGGYIYNLIGGAFSSSSRNTMNDSYLFIKGGSVDLVIGGAGVSETYGNRIVSVTGGQVNYGVFGGSNGNSGDGTSSKKGTLDGDTFVYIGGTALIGGGSSTGLFDVSPGNVFGAGNGNSTVSTIGSVGNSKVLINGGTIQGSVFGGGNYGAVGADKTSGAVTTDVRIYAGTINGSVYGGGNRNGAGTSNVTATINVTVNGGTIDNSVFGGSNIKGVIYGSTNVNINGGTIKADVYGGGEGGYQNSNNPGTYVRDNVNVTIGDTSVQTTPRIEGNVYGGSAFGTVNGTTESGSFDSTKSTTVTINKGTIINNVFGGSKGGTVSSVTYTPKEYGTVTVTVNGGSIGKVFGGNDLVGSPSGTDIVYLNGGTIGNAFGGGNNTGQATTNIYLQGSTISNNIYGGSNESGDITTSNVTITSGTVQNVFGANNIGGTTTTTNVNVSGATTNQSIYGGGNEVGAGTTNVSITGGTINEYIFGGSNQLGTVTETNVTINTNQHLLGVYGGNNAGGNTVTANVLITNGNIDAVYGGGYKAVTGSTDVEVTTGTITELFGGGNYASVTETNVEVNGGTFENIYGGGNRAAVQSDTEVYIDNATISVNSFGGGNQGEVLGNTNIIVKDSSISGSLYAGGNEAYVRGNTTVTVEGSSTIGTIDSVAPNGSVFGSGNSAGTGSSTTSAIATVNIVGGTVYRNVYGGANTSVVYGAANVKIGTSAVDINGLDEDNILIKGTVFGGGESNAAGSPTYDYTAISVTEEINININGEGYIENSHTFQLEGSIFGSGNASSSSGTSSIYIKKLGTLASPSENVSIQRTQNLTIDESVIHLTGAKDTTNKYSDDLYSFSLIGKRLAQDESIGGLTIKNNTTLLLDQNANQLVSFTSSVDVEENGVVTEEIAAVNIDDETKVVTKNVDNRVYMLANKNLNVTLDEDATEYGVVTGMTFFGMYRNSVGNITQTGVYDCSEYTYGTSSDASELVIGSSYVLGQHLTNHDITVNGFYTNYLDEDTNYSAVRTAYIEPTPNNTNYYRWQIGTESIEYEFTMTASKYLSMGTHALSLIDFPNGDTTFTVLQFDDSEFQSDLTLVDESQVPKFARVGSEESKKFGLNMKSETTEWTGYKKTSFLSANGGSFTGDQVYLTNSEAGAASLMFYLYHAKNIEMQGDLGTLKITMEAITPKNGYEVDMKIVTIIINIIAQDHNDGDQYDASITYGKKYTMPITTAVNITPKSQFTEYFSLISNGEQTDVYGTNLDNYRTLVSSYVLPVGTTITMLDVSGDTPKYYYYEVNSTNYQEKVTQLATDHEVTYKLSDFLAMDTTTSTNKYSDSAMNSAYYDDDLGMAYEEFLFIFDFKGANITAAQLDNEMLFEMRNSQDRTTISVLEKRLEDRDMVFNIYTTSNIALSQTVTTANTNYYYDSPNTTIYTSEVSYSTGGSNIKVIDTNYEASCMGVNIQFFNSEGNSVSSSMLSGTKITINNVDYFVDSDGVFRIKLADKVTRLTRNLNITVDSLLPAGNYTVKYSIIASSDGLHTSELDTSSYTESIQVVSSNNEITVDNHDKTKIFYSDTGLNELGDDTNSYVIKYTSSLNNTNLRLSVYKRKTNRYDATEYVEIDHTTVIATSLARTMSTTYPYEVTIPFGTSPRSVSLKINENAPSGTYKLVFKLCDGDQVVDTDEAYLIVKKQVVSN